MCTNLKRKLLINVILLLIVFILNFNPVILILTKHSTSLEENFVLSSEDESTDSFSFSNNGITLEEINENLYGEPTENENNNLYTAIIIKKEKNFPLEIFKDFFDSTFRKSLNYKYDDEYLLNSKTTTKGLDIELSFAGRIFKDLNKRMNTIYPGTIWCGIGNMASNEMAIGLFRMADICCREHDKCPLSIPSKSTDYGLINVGYFARSHCDCDRRFYYCLKSANTFVARKIGITYFNILRPQCFRKEYPIVKCIEWFENRCLTYLVDEKLNRTWQWFDNRHF